MLMGGAGAVATAVEAAVVWGKWTIWRVRLGGWSWREAVVVVVAVVEVRARLGDWSWREAVVMVVEVDR